MARYYIIIENSRTMCWYYMTADEYAVTAEKCAENCVSEYFETADECADTAEYVLILYEYVKKKSEYTAEKYAKNCVDILWVMKQQNNMLII